MEKKGHVEAVQDYLENCAHVKVDIEVLESLLKPEKPRGLSKVRPEVLNEKRQHIFCSSSTRQRSRTTSWQAEDDGWRVREKWCAAREWAKTSGMVLSIKE